MTHTTPTDPTVIDLWQRRNQEMNPIVSDVIKYWEGLRAGGLVPARADIDPRAISDALAHAFILDRARPGVVRFRLAGTHLNELMGMEVRGMPVRAFFELSERKRLMEHVESVFTGPCHLSLDLVSDAPGRVGLEGQMTLLPLCDHEGQINRALGAFVTEGLIGLPPRRFRIRRAGLTPLRAGRPLLGSRAPADRLQQPGFDDAPDPYTPPQRHAPGDKPALRILPGGKG